MNIEEMKQKKIKLLEDMSLLCMEFQQETGVCIDDIEYTHVSALCGPRILLINDIRVGL